MKNYHSSHAVPYEAPDAIGYLDIAMLPFLQGKKWDEVALAYVHALRPSSIRVTQGEVKLDARSWRVTVTVNKDNIIQNISQEVEVGIPEPITCGEHLFVALRFGLSSPQSQWYVEDPANPITTFVEGMGAYAKRLKNGEMVPFPEPDQGEFTSWS